MIKRLFKTIAYAMIVSCMLIPSGALAQPVAQESPEEGHEEFAVSEIAAELGLTSEQKEQLKEQRYQAMYKRIDIANKRRLKELELRYELEKKEINREAINKIIGELKEIQATMLEQRVNSILKMKEILTPEQFEKLQYLGLSKPGRQKGFKGLRDRFKEWRKQ